MSIKDAIKDKATVIDTPLNGEVDRGVFEIFTIDELDDLPPMDWVVDNMIPVRGKGMVYGPPGCGKTFVVIDLCCALAKGSFLFAKEFGIKGPYEVLYCAGEKFHGIPKRMRAAKRHWDLDTDARARFHVMRGVPQLFDQGQAGNVESFIKDVRKKHPGKIDLIVIDTMHAATIGSNENDSRDGGVSIASIEAIQAAFGCAVIIVHHTNKSGVSERGSTAWRGAVDMILKVERDESDKTRMKIACEKMSDADDDFNLEAKLTPFEDMDTRVLEWFGRGSQKIKDLSEDVIRILKSYYGQWMTATDVFGLVTVEGATNRACLTALNRQFERGEYVSGVHRKLKDEKKPSSKNNPLIFMYDRSQSETDQEPEPDDPYADDP